MGYLYILTHQSTDHTELLSFIGIRAWRVISSSLNLPGATN